MSGSGTVAGEPPPIAAPQSGEPGRWRKYALAAGFLAPAVFFLVIWIVYPTVRTIFRSFFDKSGEDFVWFDNYKQIFTSDVLLTAVKNNFIWIAIVPALVTIFGLIFAVLTERVSWSVAFKTCVFMPMAISAFAAGITWRIVYIENPDQGALNAAIAVVHDTVNPPGVLSSARPSTEDLAGSPSGGLTLKQPLNRGRSPCSVSTAVAADEVPKDAKQAVQPEPLQGGIKGVVWRDFKPGGGTCRQSRARRARAAPVSPSSFAIPEGSRSSPPRRSPTAPSSSPPSRTGSTRSQLAPRPLRSRSAASAGSARSS